MRLVSFGEAGQERPGLLLGDHIMDVALATRGRFNTIRQLLAAGNEGLDLVQALSERPQEDWLKPRRDTRLGPPVTNPSKIVCLGLNYKCHAEEQSVRLPARPLLFAKGQNSLAGHLDPIWYPADEHNLDYEAELAVVIGKPAFRIPASRWTDFVAGYTILNDVSARDAQFGDRKWFRGKSFDSTGPMGPVLVTPDEIADPHALDISATLNDQVRQKGNTSDLIFNIPETLEFVTRNISLAPGDVIATGTPAGVGIFMKPNGCMKPGDTIAVTVEGIGELVNTVQERTLLAPSPYPCP